MCAEKSAEPSSKTQKAKPTSEIKKKKRELARLETQEERARKRWTKGYQRFMKAAEHLARLKRHGTQKEESLKGTIAAWPNRSAELTKDRDSCRARIRKTEQELASLSTILALLTAVEATQAREIDEIVTQVFALNQLVVGASRDREDCLKRHVFPRLFDADGNLRSQLTFTSSDGTKRVVAMVNTMTIVQTDLAGEAKEAVEQFFTRFRRTAKIAKGVRPLYELTQKLLYEHTTFKVGPDLYRFLVMELDGDVFPELVRAQMLLRQSIRSEKTTQYIRLYERESVRENWTIVPQS